MYGNRVYINERLCSENRRLLSLARAAKFKVNEAKPDSFKYLWVKNGRILAKVNEDSRYFQIRSESDIELIK